MNGEVEAEHYRADGQAASVERVGGFRRTFRRMGGVYPASTMRNRSTRDSLSRRGMLDEPASSQSQAE